MKYFFLNFFFSLSFLGCGTLPKLKIERNTMPITTIKTHGLYYNLNSNKEKLTYIVLYQNGILLNPLIEIETNATLERVIRRCMEKQPYFYNLPYCWGLFKIENNYIKTEEWRSEDGGYGINRRSYRIINDSTLLLEKQVYADTFHFYYMPIKPDSTNKFIK